MCITHTDSDTDRYYYCHAKRHCYRHIDAYGNINGDGYSGYDSYGDSNSNIYAYVHAQTDADAPTGTDRAASPDSGTPDVALLW